MTNIAKQHIKEELSEKLKQEHCFWSYSADSVNDIPDDILIEKTLVYLDIDEINSLFLLYPFKKIKQVWLELMVPQGDYMYTLNRFLAWYYFHVYFHVKQPDKYIKSMSTRHFNKYFQ